MHKESINAFNSVVLRFASSPFSGWVFVVVFVFGNSVDGDSIAQTIGSSVSIFFFFIWNSCSYIVRYSNDWNSSSNSNGIKTSPFFFPYILLLSIPNRLAGCCFLLFHFVSFLSLSSPGPFFPLCLFILSMHASH